MWTVRDPYTLLKMPRAWSTHACMTFSLTGSPAAHVLHKLYKPAHCLNKVVPVSTELKGACCGVLDPLTLPLLFTLSGRLVVSPAAQGQPQA